jgi:hypothetical protein
MAPIIRHGINNGVTAVHRTLIKALGYSAAIVALGLFGYAAQAQAPKKEPAPKAEAKKAPPKCNTLKTQAACEARDDCSWVAESKDAKGKVKAKAYCRAKPKAPAKKEPAKK